MFRRWEEKKREKVREQQKDDNDESRRDARVFLSTRNIAYQNFSIKIRTGDERDDPLKRKGSSHYEEEEG